MSVEPHSFQATRWTLVRSASGDSPESRQALSDLCAAYYEPIVAFLRREGREASAAREVAQDFFAGLLERGGLAGADASRGRFRSYLLGALKHHLSGQRRHESRLKRGGGAEHIALDAPPEDGSPALEIADSTPGSPDAGFDRQWALTVMHRALQTVEARFARSGKAAQFETLKGWLAGNSDGLSQASAAAALGVSIGALQVMIHRLRKDFRAAVEAEIAQTLPAGEDPAAELSYLIEVLTREG